MALYLINVQAHFVMNNIFEGLIWFFLPAALVIVNDIFAYICGVLFGRTQLIKLSPKKTVEGFVGAWICTVIWAFVLTALLIQSKYFICPVNVRLSSLGFFFWDPKMCELGSRRQYLHRPKLQPEPSLHSSRLPPPRLPHAIPALAPLPPLPDALHRPHPLPHADLRHIRLPHCPLRRLLRLRP